MKTVYRLYLIFIMGVIFLALYVYGAILNADRVNIDMNRTDQASFMRMTQQIHESKWTFTGNRNQMPAYSYVQLFSYKPTIDDQEFFRRGKYFNIILSVIFLLAIFIVMKMHFPVHHTLNAILVIAFSVFIFKAGYFHCSLLYYFLHFISFLMLLRMLVKPTITLGILTGAIMGISYLTKASFLPFIVIAFIFMGAKLIGRRGRGMLTLLLSVLALAIVIFPYLKESKKTYGRYFYNVNSNFYMWYESRPEIFADSGTRAHGDRRGWPDLQPEKIPGPLKYLQEHTPLDIFQRIVRGSTRMLKHSVGSELGFFKFVVLYFLISILGLFFSLRRGQKQALTSYARDHLLPLVFVVCYFSCYMTLFAFYMETGPIIRHVLLMMPIMLSENP